MNTGSVSDVFPATRRNNNTTTTNNNNFFTVSNTGCTIKSSGYGRSLPHAQVHELVQHEELADQPFSFPMLLPSPHLQRGESPCMSNKNNNKELKHLELHHHHQQLESFREKYIDMDIALPCAWESMKRQAASSSSSKSSSVDSQEFDFSRSLRALDPACDTPADELFYNGQLLPLHCKLKDEGDDEAGEEEDEEVGQDAKADSFSFKSQSGLLKDSGCVSPDRFPTPAAAAGLADSRSSSFRSSSSYWDSGDKDSGDSSSSCRDSNGSSTDSCFEAPSQASQAAAVVDVPESVVVSSSKVKGLDNTSKGSLNWRKSPFKWKVLLGGSRRASLSASSSCSSTSSASSASRSSGVAAAGALKSERRRNHSFTYGSSSHSTSLSSSGPLLGSFFNGQGQFRHSVSSSSAGGGGGGLSAKSLRKSECSSSAHGSTGGNNSSSSSSRVLHKYLKLLRPFGSSNSSSSVSNNTTASVTATSTSTTTTTNNNFSLSSSSTSGSTYSYTTGQRKSEPSLFGPFLHGGGGARPPGRSLEEWRIYYEQQQLLHQHQQQHDKELITCPSFLPGSLRVSSFSSRRSSTHASCVTSSRSSPNHSGVLKQCVDGGGGGSSLSSSMADLQSAIQGAIAHCKKSQTTTPCVSVRQPIMANSFNNWNNCGAPVVVVQPEPTTNNNNTTTTSTTNNNNTKFVVVTQQLHAAGTLASALADNS